MNTTTTIDMKTTSLAPKIELRGIKTSAFASEETHCYTATLWVDGEKWGTVGNDGHGGPDRFDGCGGRGWADMKALDERIKATMPQHDVGYMYGPDAPAGEHMLDESLEMICGEIVNAHLMSAALRRALARNYLFTKPGQEGVFQIALRGHAHEAVHARVSVQQPGIRALHLLPFEEALAIYRTQT